MNNWITSDFLKSTWVDEFQRSIWSIERTSESTSIHVNDLLSAERITYIRNNNEGPIILWEDKSAITYFQRQLVTYNEDGREEWRVWIGSTTHVESLDEWIRILWNLYPWAKIERIQKVWIIKKWSMLEDKPSWEYVWFQIEGKNFYAEKDDVEECSEGSEIMNMSLMETTEVPEWDLEGNTVIVTYFSDILNEDPSAGIEEASSLFKSACSVLEKRAPHIAKTQNFQTIKRRNIDSLDDIHGLLEQTRSSSWRESSIACTLLKYMFLLKKNIDNPIYKEIKKLQDDDTAMDFIRDKFTLPNQSDIKKDERWIFRFKKNVESCNNVEVEVHLRIKSFDSILQKALADGKYLDISSFKDLIWMTVYIPEEYKKQNTNIMQAFDDNLLWWEWEVKNKNFLKNINR